MARVAARNRALSRGSVVVEKRPQKVGHGEGDMQPVAVGKYVALLRYLQLRGFMSAGAAAS